MRLYNRDFRLTAGIKIIESNGLRITFDVLKTIQRTHDTASISIYNLNQQSRAALQGDIRLILEAGYQEKISELFNGILQLSGTERQGPDIITSFDVEDGAETRNKRTALSFPKGTIMKDIVKAVSAATGLDIGKATKDMDSAEASVLYKLLFAKSEGFSASGSVEKILDEVTKKLNMDYQINGGELKITARGRPTNDPPIPLNVLGGLIGVPSIGAKGVVTAKTLLMPELLPKQRVLIESSTSTGTYMIQQVRFIGDNYGQDWYSEIEAIETL